MKKVLAGIIALLVSTMTLFAARITTDDAALVANHFMNVRSSVAGVKKAPAKKMVMKQIAATEEENQYFLYENENGEGWVIIAANDVVTPILAYSETGHFRTDNMPSNLRNWMSKYNHFISRLEAEGVSADEETAAQWKALRQAARQETANAVVGPLITTQWDQDSPYYDLCPGTGKNKAYTGCVATAMAQVMNYWEWPIHGQGSRSYRPLNPNTGKASTRYKDQLSADFENTYYDWSNMLDKYTSSATNAQKVADRKSVV